MHCNQATGVQMDDISRQVLQEYEKIVEKHSKFLNRVKEGYKNDFKLGNEKELLKERKNAFDYRVTRMLHSYGFYGINIRDNLDQIWDNIPLKQPKYQRYLRAGKYFALLAAPIVAHFDETVEYVEYTWIEYCKKVKKYIREDILDEQSY